MSVNGLTTKEEKTLSECLRKLDALYDRRAHLGGGEATAVRNLAAKIRVRLNPPNAADLAAEAEKIFEPCREFTWFELAMEAA